MLSELTGVVAIQLGDKTAASKHPSSDNTKNSAVKP